MLFPKVNVDLWSRIGEDMRTDAFKVQAVDWLAGAVRVETETFDDMGPVDEDPRWESRLAFHDYLETAFPLVHGKLKLTKVNTYGLLYEWEGSDASLKPILMAAHQDVVPVNPDTVQDWTHPPYSGYYDGTRIWGRGSNDDKSGLIGTISAVEILLKNGFKPTRTVVMPFGFDEEGGGLRGASSLAKVLEERYGKDGFAFIIDEGGGFTEQYGTIFATPGVAEKGSFSIRMDLATKGGHSSVPPEHTSIGILSALLTHMESHPFERQIDRTTPTYQMFQCLAQHSYSMPSSLREVIRHSLHSDEALRKAESVLLKDRVYRALVSTTQAVDIIHGGVKSNALPEEAWAVVNHRVKITSSVEATVSRDISLLKPLVEHFNLTFSAFGKPVPLSSPLSLSYPSEGSLKLSYVGGINPPAPITPWDLKDKNNETAPFRMLAGTIRSVFHERRKSADGQDAQDVVVSPGMPTVGTDTRWYWNLTKHVLRYSHHDSGNSTNPFEKAHTVDEFLDADNLVETIKFFLTLILNADESREF
ncbi:carboxypeptidase S [Dendrothele bispora CBS 962.96]|uniref:Carboxypeptidase S n=1 Tax=Dendrothele bispora (strain CBS 962.96) TaxID=1314807 RepID=A0A4S8M7Y9_DENBC|nr:carboxypeptidase S [Dendrothele bispora CBS 962.96]